MSLGPMELVLLLGVALLFFGPSRLPDLGKSIGEAIRGFKKGMEDEGEKPAPKEQIVASETQTSTATEKEKHKID